MMAQFFIRVSDSLEAKLFLIMLQTPFLMDKIKYYAPTETTNLFVTRFA